MYERFTDRARKVMQLANQEAQRFNHEYIGTEHILLGLIVEGCGVGANVLKNFEIDVRKMRREVKKMLQSRPDMVTSVNLPQTPGAKRVLEYARDEARNLNHNYVGTEHLLLGLVRATHSVAAQVLMNLGLELKEVREQVLSLLGVDARGSVRKVRPLKYANRTRKVMLLAAEEAYHLCHTYIGPEHILLGIYREATGAAVEFLKNAGLTEVKLRREVGNVLREVEEIQRAAGVESEGGFQLNLLATRALSLAAAAASSLSSEQIDSDHLVLGLLKQQSGIVDQVFINSGIQRLELANQIRSRLADDKLESGAE